MRRTHLLELPSAMLASLALVYVLRRGKTPHWLLWAFVAMAFAGFVVMLPITAAFVGTTLPLPSSNCTETAGAIEAPATVFCGCAAKAIVATAAAEMLNAALVAWMPPAFATR